MPKPGTSYQKFAIQHIVNVIGNKILVYFIINQIIGANKHTTIKSLRYHVGTIKGHPPV